MKFNKTTMLSFGSSKVIEYQLVSESDIDTAMQYLLETMQGYHGYAYKTVRKYEMHGIGELKARLQHTRLEMMDVDMLSNWEHRLYHIATESNSLKYTRLQNTAKMIKAKMRKHISFDAVTYKNFVKNYHKLHSYLTLLTQEGYIRSFTLTPSGRLLVNWFDIWDTPQVDVIEYRIRSAEDDRNIDGYNDSADTFLNQAYNALSMQRPPSDAIALWPQRNSSMHIGIGSGLDTHDYSTETAYPLPDRWTNDVSYTGQPVYLNEDKYVTAVLAIILFTMNYKQEGSTAYEGKRAKTTGS